MKYFYLLLLALFPVVCFSQDYLRGSITKLDGSTTDGYLSVEKDLTPTYVKFKTTRADADRSYSAEELLAFKINGKDSYIAFRGRISMDKNRFPYLESSLDTITAINSLFLKIVYQGKNVSFFSQTDNLKTRYFVAQGNDKPEELQFYYYNVGYDENKKVSTYKSQLYTVAQKLYSTDKSIGRRLKDASFEEDDLKKIVVLLNR